MSTELSEAPNNSEDKIVNSLLSKENFSHYMGVAEFLAKSSMVPKGMVGKPADLLIAMEMGLQVGIPMMQAIQDIAVINGKPCMYGDGLLAVVQGHKDFEWIKEEHIGDGDNKEAHCTIKRRNHEPHTVIFSVAAAKKANLWGKQGPWSQYPDRMMQMRARGFCIRDSFSDALRGIKTDEEVNDYNVVDVTPSSAPPKLEGSTQTERLLNKLKGSKRPAGNVTEGEIVEESEKVSKKQIEEIDMLLCVKEFSDDRLFKALKHFKVDHISLLSEKDAIEFISILNKAPDA